jgi:hypothetical protein
MFQLRCIHRFLDNLYFWRQFGSTVDVHSLNTLCWLDLERTMSLVTDTCDWNMSESRGTNWLQKPKRVGPPAVSGYCSDFRFEVLRKTTISVNNVSGFWLDWKQLLPQPDNSVSHSKYKNVKQIILASLIVNSLRKEIRCVCDDTDR